MMRRIERSESGRIITIPVAFKDVCADGCILYAWLPPLTVADSRVVRIPPFSLTTLLPSQDAKASFGGWGHRRGARPHGNTVVKRVV